MGTTGHQAHGSGLSIMEGLCLFSGFLIPSGNWLLVEMRLSFKGGGQKFIPEYQETLSDGGNPWRIFVQEAEVVGEACGPSPHGATCPVRCSGSVLTHPLQMLQESGMGDDRPAVAPGMAGSSDIQTGWHVCV